MSNKKSKTIKSELNKTIEKLKEAEALLKEAELEETTKLETLRKQIDVESEKIDVFCGVILTPDDIAAIIKMAIISKDSIKIPYQLYYNE